MSRYYAPGTVVGRVSDNGTCGHLRATPGCTGDYCVAVFADWAMQAIGFQRVLESGHLDAYLGGPL